MLREPAVSGQFYPAEKSQLKIKVNQYLNQAELIKTNQSLKILIVPHAGYNYSGSVAGWGFKQIPPAKDYQIILLGASHRLHFSSAAVYPAGQWQTPLGKVKIDQNLAANLINQSGSITADPAVHQAEHSLEVALPFLQVRLNSFKIVPILLGQIRPAIINQLSQAITKIFKPSTLLIISSDLSHYPDYQTANQVDQQTIKAILAGSPQHFSQAIKKNQQQPGVATPACAAQAIKAGLGVSQALKIKEIKLLKYTNSGEVTNDHSRVVGYASIGFYGQTGRP